MSRRILMFLACLCLPAMGVAGPPDGSGAGGLAPGGKTISLLLHWDGASPMPSGALLACRARVMPISGAGPGGQPGESLVVVPGGGRQCAMEIPLAWQGSATPAAVTVIYEMDEVAAGATVARRNGSLQMVAGGAVRLSLSM